MGIASRGALLAFAESKSASTNNYIIWVWISLQFGTKHPIDLGYYDINFVLNTNVTTIERDWVFGNVLCIYCH